MDPPGHGGGRCRQARSRVGNPAAHTPSATVRELRQSRLVLGLLRLGERLPALAWGMARGKGERAREEGLKRSVTGWDRGREGKHVELRTGGMWGRERGGIWQS